MCRGLAWGLPGAAGELPAPARPWVLVGSGMCLPGSVSGTVPGLSHGALLPAPCLPSSPRCAVLWLRRPALGPPQLSLHLVALGWHEWKTARGCLSSTPLLRASLSLY